MRIVEMDGSLWKSPLDFYVALREAIDQNEYNFGLSVDAFLEAMVWMDLGGLKPPYELRILNLAGAPDAVRSEVALMISLVAEARQENVQEYGVDVEVSISAPDLMA